MSDVEDDGFTKPGKERARQDAAKKIAAQAAARQDATLTISFNGRDVNCNRIVQSGVSTAEGTNSTQGRRRRWEMVLSNDIPKDNDSM